MRNATRNSHSFGVRSLVVSACLALAPGVALAQAPPPPPITAVMVNLTIKPDTPRPQLMKVMPDEVKATVKLYLDGKIQQWYARGDGTGVIFILNSATISEAKSLMEQLPLAKAQLANFEFTALGPLTPLRLLLAEPPSSAAKDQR